MQRPANRQQTDNEDPQLSETEDAPTQLVSLPPVIYQTCEGRLSFREMSLEDLNAATRDIEIKVGKSRSTPVVRGDDLFAFQTCIVQQKVLFKIKSIERIARTPYRKQSASTIRGYKRSAGTRDGDEFQKIT